MTKESLQLMIRELKLYQPPNKPKLIQWENKNSNRYFMVAKPFHVYNTEGIKYEVKIECRVDSSKFNIQLYICDEDLGKRWLARLDYHGPHRHNLCGKVITANNQHIHIAIPVEYSEHFSENIVLSLSPAKYNDFAQCMNYMYELFNIPQSQLKLL